MEGEFAKFVDDGVARVAAALIADNNIKVLGEQIDHSALALVTPVDAYNCCVCHIFISLFFGESDSPYRFASSRRMISP